MLDPSLPSEPARPAASAVSPFRIVLGVVLLVMVIAGVVDFLARRSAQKAHETLQAALEREDTLDPAETINDVPLSPAEVEKLVGRPPDGPGEVQGDVTQNKFSWRGVFYRYVVYVVYQGGGGKPIDDTLDTMVLRQVTLNEPPLGE